MTIASSDPAASVPADELLPFLLADRDARGRLVRLGAVVDAILAAHADPMPLQHLLAEALVLTALLGSLVKDEAGQVTLQAQCEGGLLSLLVCDWRAGALRGYVKAAEVKAAEPVADGVQRHAGVDGPFASIVGRGYLAITFDGSAPGERYQGIVPLEGASLVEAVEHYFDQSEQLPTCLRIAADPPVGDMGWRAGGLLLQALPHGEAGRVRLHVDPAGAVEAGWPHWSHLEVMAGSVRPGELTDTNLPLSELAWRLFHDEGEVRLMPAQPVSRGCRCDPAHIRSVLERFPREERHEMADPQGRITVDCAFCSRQFHIEAGD